MKLLYISSVEKNYTGVLKKIDDQIKAFQKNNFEVYHLNCFTDKSVSKCYLWFLKDKKILKKIPVSHSHFTRMIESFKWGKIVSNFCIEENISVIYARALHNLLLPSLKFFSKNLPIFVEFPTYPYHQEVRRKFSQQILLYLHKIADYTHWFCTENVITFSSHTHICGIPCINISNGVNVEEMEMVSKTPHETINFTFVGTIAKWHGVDRFLYSLLHYGLENVRFNIVGDGPELKNLRTIVEQSEYLKKVTIFHGTKIGNELQNVYNNTDIAVGSLAFYRINKVNLVNSIKNREYCAVGLPFIYAGTDPLFDATDFVYKAPLNETLISIQDIIRWYQNLNVTSSQIRQYALENCTWEKQLEPVIKKMKYIIKKSN